VEDDDEEEEDGDLGEGELSGKVELELAALPPPL
jgi:hypothetical protein